VNRAQRSLQQQNGKRRSKRLPVQLPVRWVRRDGDLDLEASDIGLHGMFVSTDLVTTPGSLLQLVVTLPSRAVRMFVTVRFVGATTGGRGIGAEIFLMDELDLRVWREHYRAQLARFQAAPLAVGAPVR